MRGPDEDKHRLALWDSAKLVTFSATMEKVEEV